MPDAGRQLIGDPLAHNGALFAWNIGQVLFVVGRNLFPKSDIEIFLDHPAFAA
jgi:hypothetical protein